MVQVGRDYYEDLSEESFENLLDKLIDGNPEPGSRKKRFSSEPEGFFKSFVAAKTIAHSIPKVSAA